MSPLCPTHSFSIEPHSRNKQQTEAMQHKASNMSFNKTHSYDKFSLGENKV